MRIAIDARLLQGEYRGQGQYLYHLVKALSAAGGGHRYVLFYNGLLRRGFAFDRGLAGVEQVWCRFPGSLLRRSWRACSLPRMEQLVGSFDLFHSPFNFNLTHYSPIPTRAKSVATFHGMASPGELWSKPDLKGIESWFRAVAGCSRIIAVSEAAKKNLMELSAVDPARITVIPLGCGENFSSREDPERDAAVLARYGLRAGTYILYVGAAEENKNLTALLEAYSLLLKGGIEHSLVLCGSDDANYRSLKRKAQEMGIAGKVVFTGYIGQTDLPSLYRGARLFTLPSLQEWFGIPLLEAMNCGVPVAASRECGIPAVCGDAALLFDPRDSEGMARTLRQALLDEGLRGELRERGIRRAAGFSWQLAAQRTLEVYREAAA